MLEPSSWLASTPFPFTKINVMPPNPQVMATRQPLQNQQPQAAQPRGVQPGFQQQQQQQHPSQIGFNPAAQPINPTTAVAATLQPAVPSQQQGRGGLPPGWLQLSDPSSGRMYYVNQATANHNGNLCKYITYTFCGLDASIITCCDPAAAAAAANTTASATGQSNEQQGIWW